MEISNLEAFKVLSRHLHLGRAASVLHTSPSTLSRLIKDLEKETGSVLLERDTRGMQLTRAGRLFLNFAEETLNRRNDLSLVLGQINQGITGTLRVFASVTACYSILPAFVKALRQGHPSLLISIMTGDPAEAKSALTEGKVDLALSALPYGGFPGLEAFRVKQTPLVFVAAKEEAYGSLKPTKKTEVSLAQILACPLILPARGLARKRFDKWVKPSKPKINLAAETAGNEALLALAHLGLGLGLVPQLVLENSPFSSGLVTYHAGEALGDYEIGFLLPHQKSSGDGFALKTALKNILERAYPQGEWLEGGVLRRDQKGRPLID